MTRCLLLLLLCACGALAAQEPYTVGDTPVDHSVDYWLNPSPYTQFSDFRGDVVLFKKWGCT